MHFISDYVSSQLPMPKKRLPTPQQLPRMRQLPQNKKRRSILCKGKLTMAKHSDVEAEKKREKIQAHFYSIVGSVEHISIPKLEDAIRKEFNCKDDRFIQAQIRLMQTEAKIRVQSNVKVWLKQPNTDV
jgi:hypothetical protein